MKYKFVAISSWGFGASEDLQEAMKICKQKNSGMPSTDITLYKVETGKKHLVGPDGVFNSEGLEKAEIFPLTKEEEDAFKSYEF